MPTGIQPSYSHGTSATALLGETIGANLRRITGRFGESEAVVDVPAGRRWTYRQLEADTDALARGLLAAGIAARDRVGIWAPNCAEWVLLQFATAKIGAILVNINPAYRSHELAYVLRQAGVRLLVSAERFKTSDYRAMIDEVRGEAPGLERVIYLGTPEWDELLTAGARADGGALALAAEKVIAKARAISAKILEVAPEDVEQADDGFAVSGVPDKKVSWRQVAAAA